MDALLPSKRLQIFRRGSVVGKRQIYRAGRISLQYDRVAEAHAQTLKG